LGVRCKRPKLELLHGEDYEEGKERVENYKIADAFAVYVKTKNFHWHLYGSHFKKMKV